MEIFKPNGSSWIFYPNLLKTSFIYKMSKNKAHPWIEHLLNTRYENWKWNKPKLTENVFQFQSKQI